jgi:hypothetical protein
MLNQDASASKAMVQAAQVEASLKPFKEILSAVMLNCKAKLAQAKALTEALQQT